VVTTDPEPIEADDSSGIAGRIRPVVDRAKAVVVYVLYWGVAAAWGGLWLLVAGLHLRQGDLVGSALSGVMGIAPVVLVAVSSVRRLTDGRPVTAFIPG